MPGYQYRGKRGRTRAEILEDAEERWQEKAYEQYQADPPPAQIGRASCRERVF